MKRAEPSNFIDLIVYGDPETEREGGVDTREIERCTSLCFRYGIIVCNWYANGEGTRLLLCDPLVSVYDTTRLFYDKWLYYRFMFCICYLRGTILLGLMFDFFER